MQRFFRAAPEVYESVRQAVDAAFGHPNAVAKTAFSPVADAPIDTNGMALLAVRASFCDWPEVASVLPDLLASGAVEEIDEATYQASLPAAEG